MANKRLKSGLITLVSLIAAVIVTPQWAEFVAYVNGQLVYRGWSLAVIGLVTVIISEGWKKVLNDKMIAKANEIGAGLNTLDLY